LHKELVKFVNQVKLTIEKTISVERAFSFSITLSEPILRNLIETCQGINGNAFEVVGIENNLYFNK